MCSTNNRFPTATFIFSSLFLVHWSVPETYLFFFNHIEIKIQELHRLHMLYSNNKKDRNFCQKNV